jgi:hypothetical protein
MTSYLANLQAFRAQRVAAIAPEVGPPPPKGRKGETPPLKPGGRPAPKVKEGLSGAAKRQTIGDLFGLGARLGLPPLLVAQLVPALAARSGPLAEAARALEACAEAADPAARELLSRLVGRLVHTSLSQLLALDARSSASIVEALVKALCDLSDAHALDPARGRALEIAVFVVAQLQSIDAGADLTQAARILAREKDSLAAEVAANVLAENLPKILQSAEGSERSLMFRTALDAAQEVAAGRSRDAGAIAREAALRMGFAASSGQREVIAQLVRAARETGTREVAERARAEREVQALKAEFDRVVGRDPPVAAAADKAQSLSPAAQRAFYREAVRAAAMQRREGLASILSALLGELEHAQPILPPDDVLQGTTSALVNMLQNGVVPQAIDVLSDPAIGSARPDTLPDLFALCGNLSAHLRQQKRKPLGAEELQALATGLVERTAAHANANGGPYRLLARCLSEAPPEALAKIAGWAPRFAQAAANVEAMAPPQIQQDLPKDLAALAKLELDPTVVAAAYPTLPEDSIARFAGIALRRKLDPDAFFGQLADAFKEVRKSKEHTRALRRLIVMTDVAGVDPSRLIAAFAKAGLETQKLARTVNALLAEQDNQISQNQIERAIAAIEAKQDYAAQIQDRMHQAMLEKLRLPQLLQGASGVNVTKEGFAAVSGPLAQQLGALCNNGGIDKALIKNMVIAILEDRYGSYRFETPAAKRQLKCLTPEQRASWESNEQSRMTHIRFTDDGRAKFARRVNAVAQLAKPMLDGAIAALGDRRTLEKKRDQLVAQLRNLDKNNAGQRKKLIAEVRDLPRRIALLELLEELAWLTPDTTTPLGFTGYADAVRSLRRSLGPTHEPAVAAMLAAMQLADLPYHQVVTDDALDLGTQLRLAQTNCLNGNLVAALAYCIDPNKRMIATKTGSGEGRAILRLVDRKDPGNVGKPMLLLERCYPDRISEEEKQRFVEHALRRAVDMGVPIAYPTEYYWDASTTQRGQAAGIVDMNRVIEDLTRRYNCEEQRVIVPFTIRAGNMNMEYLDSAPANINQRGLMANRIRQGQQDFEAINEFVVLTPKSSGR